MRAAPDPAQVAADFLDSDYRAGTRLTGWDWQQHDSPGGVTDPAYKRT